MVRVRTWEIHRNKAYYIAARKIIIIVRSSSLLYAGKKAIVNIFYSDFTSKTEAWAFVKNNLNAEKNDEESNTRRWCMAWRTLQIYFVPTFIRFSLCVRLLVKAKCEHETRRENRKNDESIRKSIEFLRHKQSIISK